MLAWFMAVFPGDGASKGYSIHVGHAGGAPDGRAQGMQHDVLALEGSVDGSQGEIGRRHVPAGERVHGTPFAAPRDGARYLAEATLVGPLDPSCRQRLDREISGRKQESVELAEFDARSGLRNCHRVSDDGRRAIVELAKRTGRLEDIRVWSRNDLTSSTFKSSCKTGPTWTNVLGRVTIADSDCGIIEQKLTESIGRSGEHAKLPDGKCDVTTFLLCVSERPLMKRDHEDARRQPHCIISTNTYF